MENYVDIIGFEGKFQISDLGNVKRLSYKAKNKNGYVTLTEIIKKNSLNWNGYYFTRLGRNNPLLVHRLVAIAFIPNPQNKSCVNHIDGNKLNNYVNNLEWCTKAENNQHAYDVGLKKGYWTKKSGDKHHSSKQVTQYDLSGNIIQVFGSASEASRITGFKQPNICKCCRGESQTYKKFNWEYSQTTLTDNPYAS